MSAAFFFSAVDVGLDLLGLRRWPASSRSDLAVHRRGELVAGRDVQDLARRPSAARRRRRSRTRSCTSSARCATRWRGSSATSARGASSGRGRSSHSCRDSPACRPAGTARSTSCCPCAAARPCTSTSSAVRSPEPWNQQTSRSPPGSSTTIEAWLCQCSSGKISSEVRKGPIWPAWRPPPGEHCPAGAAAAAASAAIRIIRILRITPLPDHGGR